MPDSASAPSVSPAVVLQAERITQSRSRRLLNWLRARPADSELTVLPGRSCHAEILSLTKAFLLWRRTDARRRPNRAVPSRALTCPHWVTTTHETPPRCSAARQGAHTQPSGHR